MNSLHLDNDALLRVHYGAGSAAEAAHAASCPACAAALAAREARRPSPVLPELPESFWQRQAAGILSAAPSAPSLRWAFAGSLAVALLGALVVGASSPPPRPLYTAADDRLLQDIHQTVSRIEPQALAPAILLLPQHTREVRPQ